MDKLYIDFISHKLSIASWQVEHCASLIDEGATIPFISRYRKERTGGLDETQVAEIKHYFLKFEELEKRKKSIISSIKEQDKWDETLEKQREGWVDLQELEDIYLPYKPKRKTR